MKVGILTMHYRRNYGGILQSYALMKVLQGLGHDVEVIDFRYDSKRNKRVKEMIIKLLKALMKKQPKNSSNIAVRPLPKEHIEAFISFKSEYMCYSETAGNDTINTIVSKYDVIVVGSDQIWNNLSGKQLYFFFDWQPEYKGLRIAYAPCSIYPTAPEYNKERLRMLLNKFDAIGVRDETTASMVQSVTGVKPQIVLDPTCLYDFKEFVSEPIVEGDYIFSYILGSEIACSHQEVIKHIKGKYGDMKVVAAIIPNVSLEVEKFADDIRYNASPSDWVNLVAHSKFVYTDSFHGCMFAMKFHKQFLAYYKDARRVSRLKDIKDMYAIDNIIPSGNEIVLNNIDYNKVDAILEQKKIASVEYLRHSIENK
jgi:hypothetical protein